mmetsp:Transcript_35748/g.54730  ORF Transcript_35748/g.54730 Transcript_35748/m.54730 type:complete len:118 (-) Transcript_35748:2292-2645(-)
MIRKPLSIVTFGFFILMATSVYVFAKNLFAMTPSTDRDYLLWDHPMTVEFDMKTVAEQYIIVNAGDDSREKPLRLTEMKKWNPLIFYSAKNGGSLLEKKNLLKVQQIEADIKAMDKW